MNANDPENDRKIEADYDAMERERSVHPDERIDFRLMNLEVAASHLADLVFILDMHITPIEVQKWDAFKFLRVSARRIDALLASHPGYHEWQELWDLFKANVQSFQTCRVDSATMVSAARILFVAAFVIRQLYGSPHSVGKSGIDKAFAASAIALPFPIEGTNAKYSADAVRRNLQWMQKVCR